MPNTSIILIYLPFAIITAVILIIELARKLKRRTDYLFTMLCFCVACWFASNIFGLSADSVSAARIWIHIGLIFVGLVPPFLLLFTIKFFQPSKRIPAWVIVLLFIIPAINTFVAVTGSWHSLIVKGFDVVSLSPVRELSISWGPWFWIHTAGCYILSILTVIFITIYHFRKPKFYRLPSTLMFAGIILTLSGNLITLFKVLSVDIDPTLITVSLSLILFSQAIINNNNSKFVRFSRSQIFHYIDEFILVLDDKRVIVDLNRPAEEWFGSRKIPLISSSLDSLKEALLEKGDLIAKDYYMLKDPFPIVLYLREFSLCDESNNIIGFIAVFSDVTQNHILIERLEAGAKMDSLTGLPNRGAYEGAKKRLDDSSCLPLAVIMCDINRLKYVNDNFGHRYGDMLLQKAAEILQKSCPENGFLARIGGDEFIYLLANTSIDRANSTIEAVKSAMSGFHELPFPVSTAMGCAVKYEDSENIDEIVAIADSRMYEDKRRIKASAEAEAQV